MFRLSAFPHVSTSTLNRIERVHVSQDCASRVRNVKTKKSENRVSRAED
jgi:hypothetical protein